MRSMIAIVSGLLLVAGCISSDSEEPNGPDVSFPDDVGPVFDGDPDSGDDADATEDPVDPELRDELRETLHSYGIEPLGEPPPQNEVMVELGHHLFFDPILSGAKDTNCAFCHQMDEATTDQFPLSAGTGSVIDANGDRRPGPELSFTNRTSPDLFNLGYPEWTTMFWDARIAQLEDGRFVLHESSYPQMDDHYQRVFSDVIDSMLSAQVLLPVHSRNEMRGNAGTKDIYGEHNDAASVAAFHLEGTWKILRDRVVAVPEYADLLTQAYPDTALEDIEFTHIANTLSAFQIERLTFPESPWDDFVAGDDDALTASQIRGAHLFYGDAGCANCHGGALMTDQNLYNWAIPPMTRGPELLDNMDLGAAHRSHAGPDKEFFFRTPSLRNVELTGPYMHNGALPTLEAVIHHKMDPLFGLWNYDASHMGPVFQDQVHTRESSLARVEATVSSQVLNIPALDDDQIADLVAFLRSLTSPDARDLSHLDRHEVPSGHPVPDPNDPPAIHQ